MTKVSKRGKSRRPSIPARTRAGILKRYASPQLSSSLPFPYSFSSSRLKIHRPFPSASRGQNSTTFFFPPSWKKVRPLLHREGNVRSPWPNFFYQDYLERFERRGGEDRGDDNLYHPGGRNSKWILFAPPRGEIIFSCKSMDPRVFNQILRFVLRGGGGCGGKDGNTSWI